MNTLKRLIYKFRLWLAAAIAPKREPEPDQPSWFEQQRRYERPAQPKPWERPGWKV